MRAGLPAAQRRVWGDMAADKSTIKQAGAIPFRREEKGLRICLVTSSGSGRWGIPKGIIDPGETPQETALKETEEEAGVTGRVFDDPVGKYRYRKWGSEMVVRVYLLEVSNEFREWAEQDVRKRRWVSMKKASELLDGHPVEPVWELAVEQLNGL